MSVTISTTDVMTSMLPSDTVATAATSTPQPTASCEALACGACNRTGCKVCGSQCRGNDFLCESVQDCDPTITTGSTDTTTALATTNSATTTASTQSSTESAVEQRGDDDQAVLIGVIVGVVAAVLLLIAVVVGVVLAKRKKAAAPLETNRAVELEPKSPSGVYGSVTSLLEQASAPTGEYGSAPQIQSQSHYEAVDSPLT